MHIVPLTGWVATKPLSEVLHEQNLCFTANSTASDDRREA